MIKNQLALIYEEEQMTKRISKDQSGKMAKSWTMADEATQLSVNQKLMNQQNQASSKFSDLSDEQLPEVEGAVPIWKIAVRLGGFALVLGLNFALIMSGVSFHHGLKPAHHFNELFLYGTLLFFNATILIPALFEVRWLKIGPEGLQLSTLWWKSKLSWPQVIEFRHPAYLKVAMLRTCKCFYILNKRDLTNYGLMEVVLLKKVQ